MASLAKLQAQVQAEPDSTKAADLLLKGLADALEAETQGVSDPRKEKMFAQKIRDHAPALAKAVTETGGAR